MKKIEFSKIILLVSFAFALAITVFTCVMVKETKDLTPLMYLIPAIFAEFSVGTAFYYKKAGAENVIKIRGSKDEL